jgi:hypothetical protein
MKLIVLIALLVPIVALSASVWGPMPDKHVEKIDAYLQQTLKDRDSVKSYAVSSVFQCKDSLRWNKKIWCSCIQVNAKNSFGAYTGTLTDAVEFNETTGQIILVFPAWKLNLDKKCAAAQWQDRDPTILASQPRS